MTPYPWIGDLLKAIRAPRIVRRAMRKLVPLWVTDIELKGTADIIRIPVRFKRGCFHGDTLSPLLFCLCIALLSHSLSQVGGFKSEFRNERITHQVYIDDVKLYEENKDELEATMQMMESISEVIGMSLGMTKCGVVHIGPGGSGVWGVWSRCMLAM